MLRVGIPATLALAWVLAQAAPARAGSGRKITVETDPGGATVYLNDKEAGPACTGTPCSFEAPVGENALIIELDKHKSRFEALVVPRRGKLPKTSFKLEPAVGMVVIDGPIGARVRIDEEDRGKAPAKIDVSEDSHHVVVTLNGKTLYDQWIEVSAGADTTVTPKQVASGASGGEEGGGEAELPEDGGGGEGDGGGGEGKVVKGAPAKRVRGRFIQASAALDVGFRRFTYEGVQTANTLKDEKEGGQVLAGPVIEVWPGELIGIPALRGLSLLGRFQFGVNGQPVKAASLSGPTNTFWQSMEVSLRYRFTIKQQFTVEPQLGYVRDQYQFEGTAPDVARLPDTDYKSLRLGVRASLLFGDLEPYVVLENRIVESAGKLETRFLPSTSTSGLRGALGLAYKRGPIIARVEGALARYAWTFQFDPMSTFRASGASDSIRLIQFAVGYQY